MRVKCIGYKVDVMRQFACLAPITVSNFAAVFNCMPVGLGVDSLVAPHKANYLVGAGYLTVSWPIGVHLVVFLSLQCFNGIADRNLQVSQRAVTVKPSSLLH